MLQVANTHVVHRPNDASDVHDILGLYQNDNDIVE
jgi:hypothetical protein